MIPLEIQGSHLRPDEGHELVFPKSTEVQFGPLLIELFGQEVNVSLASLGFLAFPEQNELQTLLHWHRQPL